VGVVGVGFAMNQAVHRFEDFTRDFDVGRELSRLSQLADLDSQTRLIAMDPDAGLDFLETLDAGDPADAFVREMVKGNLDLVDGEPFRRIGRVAGDVRDRATVRGDRGDVQIHLDRKDGGGSLTIDAGGEETRFELVKSDNGGFLTIEGADGNARIDLVGTGEGGYLSVASEDGNVRFDLQKRGDGAELVISGDDGTARLGLGDGADDMPGWVAGMSVFPDAPRPVYSLDSADGALGAVTWSAAEAPAEVLSLYREELESRGFELRDRYRSTGDGGDQGAFWARNESEGRMVFVVAHQEQGRTQVLLGYGERR